MANYNYVIAEFLGTFFFVTVILNLLKRNSELTPLYIGVGLIAAIILAGPISGGHLNPVISIVTFLNNSIDQNKLIIYIIAQCAGAIGAKLYFDFMNKNN